LAQAAKLEDGCVAAIPSPEKIEDKLPEDTTRSPDDTRTPPAAQLRSMRVWVDLTNTAHVLVLRPLIELLEREGHQVSLTARPLSHTLELLDDWGHPYTALGSYGGSGRLGKARAAGGRLRQMLRFGRKRGFDCALAHGSTDLPPAARALGVPNTTMLDYEWAALQHHLNCRLASRVLAPDAIPPERLARYGARPPKLVSYPGLKEDYYLAGFEPDPSVLDGLRTDPASVLCVVRTAPSYALYLRGSENPLLPRVLARLSETGRAHTVVLARTPEQAEMIESLDLPRLTVPKRAVDGRSLVALADLLISAGGTMNREAAVLGTPAYSIFEGRLGGVDEMLVAQGRLRLLADPAQIEVEKKTPEAWRHGVKRDPAELLRMALPWISDAP
jgi:predicted glycosyltransferase